MRSFNSNSYIRVIFAAIVAFATLLTQHAVFAQSDPDYWLDPIIVTTRPYQPPGSGGGNPSGGGNVGGSGEQGTAGEEAAIKRREESCRRAQAAFNVARCRPTTDRAPLSPNVVNSAVSQYAYSYLFAESVFRFTQSIWQLGGGTNIRTLIGDGIRNGATACKLPGTDKPIPTCVNQVLAFYGVNTNWLPNAEFSSGDLTDWLNRALETFRASDPASAPVGSLIRSYGDGWYCNMAREAGAANGCKPT